MWDFPGFSVVDSVIVTRCCDDLLGAASALCTLDALISIKSNCPLWCLFTRSEEIGFYGALEAVRHKTIPQNACVLSLECSKALENARQGDGVIIRVGDRASIFNPNLTAALCMSAETIAKADPSFKFQRKLMDGGACEATVFCAHDFRSSGVCVPLGNYHNQATTADGKPTIGPESVHVADYLGEIRLLTELARHPEWLDGTGLKLPKSLQERAEKAKALSEQFKIGDI
jgi:endoglucanase